MEFLTENQFLNWLAVSFGSRKLHINSVILKMIRFNSNKPNELFLSILSNFHGQMYRKTFTFIERLDFQLIENLLNIGEKIVL